jgi:hypothetical protein
MARKWTFLMKVFLGEGVDSQEVGAFEPAGISPWKMKSGPGSSDTMGSEKYAHLANAMAMADFVSNIGDKNTLSIKKVRCPLTETFQEAKRDGESLAAANLYITPLASISRGARGTARLESIHRNSLEMVTLRLVTVTALWTVNYIKGNGPTIIYDYVTFEAAKLGKFLFKGKDW